MKRIPLISFLGKTYFYADELACRCGKCRYSDPEIIPHIIDPVLKEHLFEARHELKAPIIVTRGVSCLNHHQGIYKKIYGNRWEQFVTKDSSHVPDKDKKIHGGVSEMFYGVDTIPIVPKFLKAFGVYCAFRFYGVIWYKKKFIKTNEFKDSFIHIDNYPIRKTFYFDETIYDVY